MSVASEAMPTQPSRLLLAPSKPSAFSSAEPISRTPDMGDDADNVPEPGAASFKRCCTRSEEHTSELQSLRHLVCRLLLEKKNNRQLQSHDKSEEHTSELKSRFELR